MMNSKQLELQRRRSQSRSATSNGKPTALSAASIGRTLVLLATSSAAFRSSHSTTTSIATHPRSIASSGRNQHGAIVALKYRNGDYDQPIDIMRIANAGIAMTQQKRGVPTSVNRKAITVATPRWMFPAATATVDERQVAVDEYLDYIKKRQNRLHNQGVVSVPSTPALFLSSSERFLKNLASQLRSIHQFASAVNAFQKLTDAFASSMRVMARMILLDKSGLQVAGLAIMLMCRPILKGALSQG
mmetsp:Transcript_64/g.74  ORF Transcript_64/g.74 Transcript_64/m.74 type:complete len:245 (+) Transcript_64:59-793(+)|eukprot:CAMPEP_0196147168 /NCGR_PEP_ID=MMETSP0910-20130528/24747_1 /TAXON_ID=49265 /ORGANISM="Thalassiosira rotula, Strain GSO102" /LENGTH=244 /DNA_ID=CAMNT_0041409525 /DNA_START=1 /DNA_END=735 /DNA_ORIENTATION=+